MSTVRDLVTDAFGLFGAAAAGEALSAEDAAKGLRSLIQMLAAWNTNKLLLFGTTIEEFALTSGQQSRTMGVGGNFNTAMPMRIEHAFLKDSSNSEIPIEIIDDRQWGEIPDKTVQSEYPLKLFINDGASLKTLYFWPIPSAANTVVLHSWKKLTALSSLNDTVTLPDGYEEPIVYNLGMRLAPQYGKSLSADQMMIATNSLADLKRLNTKKAPVGVDSALLGGGVYDINIGRYR